LSSGRRKSFDELAAEGDEKIAFAPPTGPRPTRTEKARAAFEGDDEFSVFSLEPEPEKPVELSPASTGSPQVVDGFWQQLTNLTRRK
jgi:hypothetical protein